MELFLEMHIYRLEYRLDDSMPLRAYLRAPLVIHNQTPDDDFPRWSALMKTFLSRNADPNEGIISKLRAVGWTGNVFIVMRESPLSHLERYISREALPGLGELFNILESYGALQQRRCCLIRIGSINEAGDNHKWDWYKVSQSQSDRLFEGVAWQWNQHWQELVPEEKAFNCALEVLIASLTEADKVDKSVTLSSSWEP